MSDSQSDVQKRLKRIEGQVRGVQRMLEDNRDCKEIIQQLTAIKSAVHNASLAYMRTYASDCVLQLDENDPVGRQALLDDLITLIGKAG